jgi:hypothetical protein
MNKRNYDKYNHKRRAAELRISRSIPARIEAICQREVTQRCKTFVRDPLDQLLKAGRIRGHKVG